MLTSLALAGLAGCALVPRDPGFDDVAREVRERSGGEIAWPAATDTHETPASEEAAERARAVEARVAILLGSELTAETAVELALLRSPRVQIHLEEMEMTRGELALSALPHNPIAGFEIRFPGLTSHPFEFTLTQTIYDLFRLGARRRLAEASWEPARLRAADGVLGVAAEVREAAYALQAAQQAAALSARIAATAGAGAELAARQQAAGNIAALEMEQQQNLADESRLNLVLAETEVATLRERLNSLLGLIGPETGWRMAAELPPLPGSEPDTGALLATARDSRLDLVAARHDVDAAARAAGLAGSEAMDGFSMGVHVEGEPDGSTSTGPAFEVPIPFFPRARAARVRAEAAWRLSRQRLAVLTADTEAELRALAGTLAGARQRSDLYETTILPRRRRIVDEAQRNYNYMLLGPAHLLLARQDEIAAQRAALEARRDYWMGRARLERALGTRLPTTAPTANGSPS